MATSNFAKLYIAGTGMVTPLGANTAMTAAAVNAGISAYKISDYQTRAGEPITMAWVPDRVFDYIAVSISGGNIFNFRNERMMRMLVLALREAVGTYHIDHAIPFALGLSDFEQDTEGFNPIVPNLVDNASPWIQHQLTRRIAVGRAAGMAALDFAFNYFLTQPQDFLLVGGVDSYQDDEILAPLIKDQRLLSSGASDTFAPGEAASVLLLTRHPELAEVRNGFAIAIHPPGMADEPGHLFSEQPYKGDGLDKAFKQALRHQPPQAIHSIYSSMNGENLWAKEYGVAYLRSKEKFMDPVKIQHPADCYGDLGAATATTLIALAAEHLHKTQNAHRHLVYSSSDGLLRGAVVLEKIAVTA